MTSAVVSIIRQNSRMAAAAPSARSSQAPASEGCDVIVPGPSVAGSDAFELLAEIRQHLGAVDALGGGVLDPFVHDRLGAVLHAFDELGRSRADLDPDPFHFL